MNNKEYMKLWRLRNKESIQETQREWRRKNRESINARARTPAGRALKMKLKLKYRQLHKDKHAAHQAVLRAVRKGKLLRPSKCSKCGIECVPHGHHPNYQKQLDVVWVCRPCHEQIHRELALSRPTSGRTGRHNA